MFVALPLSSWLLFNNKSLRPNTIRILPLTWFTLNQSSTRLEWFPINFGIPPLSWFTPKLRSFKLNIFEKDVGMQRDKSFSERSSPCKRVRWPNSYGIWPGSMFLAKLKRTNNERFPLEEGIVPVTREVIVSNFFVEILNYWNKNLFSMFSLKYWKYYLIIKIGISISQLSWIKKSSSLAEKICFRCFRWNIYNS